MSSPTAVAVAHSISKQGNIGACREFWVKIQKSDGSALSAAADCDAPSVLYYLENPLDMDAVITEAIASITTLDAQDGDIDIGLEDDAAGTDSLSTGALICDSLVNTAVAIKRLLPALDGIGVSAMVWKAAGTSTQSFLTVTQNADADVSSLRWYLLLKCIPLADLS